MGRKLPTRALIGEGRSAHRCVVAGCAEVPDQDTILCRRHSEALRPAVPPVTFSDQTGDQA